MASSYKTPEGVTIKVKSGCITKEKADVIVNSTQQSLWLHSGAISKAISGAAGRADIQAQCHKIAPNGIDNGKFVKTTGGEYGTLKCQNIYHCVLSVWKKGSSEKELKSLLKSIFSAASRAKRKSMAMPALGAGNLGYPCDVSAAITVDAVMAFSKSRANTSLKDIRIMITDHPKLQIFKDRLHAAREKDLADRAAEKKLAAAEEKLAEEAT